MGKIIQLDEHLANMIAAGEVVERPMGVVKELVENAIDAGSSRIEVSVVEGGLTSIEVFDNGCGMSEEDAKMAFLRHATSKIRVESDLFEIHSLGFRGEAIPSIASVSNMTMITNDGNSSTKIDVSYGEMKSISSFPSNQGTRIKIQGLFFQTPARLKHLKSAAYENSLIQDVVQRFAFSHPEIAFVFYSNEKLSFQTSGNGNLLEVVYTVFGNTASQNAIPVDFKDYDYHVTGYLINPSITRSNRYSSHVFMNHRMVKTYRLNKAIEEGYEDFIVKGRYPLCVLNIDVDPQLLDVNVHPSKWEIRISKQNQLEYLLKDQIREALAKSLLAPRVAIEKSIPSSSYYEPVSLDVRKPIEKILEEKCISKHQEVEKEEKIEIQQEPSYKQEEAYETIQTPQRVLYQEEQVSNLSTSKPMTSQESTFQEESFEQTSLDINNGFPDMKLIGQWADKFILCESSKGLVIIDQHAAQERVHYEEFQKLLSKPTGQMDLLVPLLFVVSDAMVQRIDEINAIVEEELFFRFEVFGSDTFAVRRVPLWMKDVNKEEMIQDVLDHFKQEETISYTKLEKKKIATMACHHSIRFNRRLTNEEMLVVIQELKECENPYHCPHGRPTFIILDEKELTKEFLR